MSEALRGLQEQQGAEDGGLAEGEEEAEGASAEEAEALLEEDPGGPWWGSESTCEVQG